MLWHAEAIRGTGTGSSQSNSLCCGRGKVMLGTELKHPPKLLKELISNEHPKSATFIDNIRRYNSMFAFTSIGAQQDHSVNVGRGPYCYCIHGENYHLDEIRNRMNAVSNEHMTSSKKQDLDYELTKEICDMLDEINPLVQDYKYCLKLIGTRQRDGRHYNLPTASEVVALIVGDFDQTKHKRDIILHQQDGDLQRISELHPSYLALQYPLFFAYAEDGYRTNIFHEGVTDYNETNKGTRVTMREWFAYRVQERRNEFSMMLNGRRLFQQFLVDGYTMVESERMMFNRK